MILSREQFKWIDENRDSIDNRDLDKLRNILYEPFDPKDKRQLLVLLILSLDLPIKVVAAKRRNKSGIYYPIIIEDWGIKLIEIYSAKQLPFDKVKGGLSKALSDLAISDSLVSRIMEKLYVMG